ncbi:MAG: Gfo/Idh/MocA family oxidoreductase [Gammaproteobacteria bacterium]|nr:Gfo/Idh/MocA family oxidoreductase [Gammaproteobacteria bacterium]
MAKLRAAVIGVGYLGNFHVQKYLAQPDLEVIGIVDANPVRLAEIAAKYRVRAYLDVADLIGNVDLVSIVTPPQHHFEAARQCLEAGVHVLVEKPVTVTVAEAQTLVDLARNRDCVFQVGHLERFNPAVIAVRRRISQPQRIEAQRLAKYQKRGTEVDVVLDLMIHDIDIVASLINSPLVEVYATGSTVITGDIDIARATLRFDNGCIAELSASRVNREPMRTMDIYQPDSYISVDYLNHTLMVGKQDPQGRRSAPHEVNFEAETLTRTDVLMDEIVSFVGAVRCGTQPTVSGEEGKRALEIAIEIGSQIRRRQAQSKMTSAHHA